MQSDTPRINRLTQVARFLRVSVLLLSTIWIIYRERKRVVSARQRGDYRVRPDIKVLIRVLVGYRTTALKLGVLLIKLGQFLSSRADLLPEEALAVLAELQDEVPPAPFAHVQHVIEQELGYAMHMAFSSIETQCTAAASLGQVHRAVLEANGDVVAVKVQRPHIDELVRMDLNTIRFVIWVITRFTDNEFIDLWGIYQEFSRTVYEEINYIEEAANAHRFRQMFENDATVLVPRVYDDYTSRRLIVLQWVEGIKINDYAGLEAAGIDRSEVARRIVEAYFHQFFVAGFFHADPHPGNIFITAGDDGYGPRVHLLDFGMVGTLTASMQKALKDVFSAYLLRDSHAIVNAMDRLGFLGKGANLESIERAVRLMLDRYYGMTLREARHLDVGEVAHDVENLLYGQPFQVPARLAFAGRAIGTLVGVSTGLSPDFNFVEVAQPYAQQFLGLDADDPGQLLKTVWAQVSDIGGALLRMPRLMERVATRLETGQLEIKINESAAPKRWLSRRRGQKRDTNGSPDRLAWALTICGGVAGGTALMLAHQAAPGWFCLGLAGITTAGLLVRD